MCDIYHRCLDHANVQSIARRRIDTILAERGLAPSRSAAASAVRAGSVRVGRGGERATKPSQMVPADAELHVEQPNRYVSRGGLKLAGALEAFDIDVSELDCLDVGASTGGFTDCLLQRGARRVVALDVGHGQLDWGLRNDRRVTSIERTNARTLGNQTALPFDPALATVDVSFISLEKILPSIAQCLTQRGAILALVKPQFELGPRRVGKGGIVRLAADRREAVLMAGRAAEALGLGVAGIAPSVERGSKGNQETFLLLRGGGPRHPELKSAILTAGC